MLNTLHPWLQQDWERLHGYILQQRIPQALLISGNPGLGKLALAKQFAYALLCSNPKQAGFSCGECQSCLLLKADTHPDYILIKPAESKKTIAVEQIRSLIVQLSLKPQFENYRVVIINPADSLTNNSANAFLKCLEEPNERTVIFLITDKPGKLPATIVSRCQKVSINKPDKSIVISWLQQQGINDDPEILFSLAQGAPLQAQAFAKDGHVKLRNDCFKSWLAVARQQTHPVLIAEEWQKLPEGPLLFWITSWVVDLIKCAYDKATDLYNPDLIKSLQELAQQLNLKKLYKLYDLLLLNRQLLDTQINKQLMFEDILIQWQALNRGTHHG
jgi:DNA polymerase-3 subunit delta'